MKPLIITETEPYKCSFCCFFVFLKIIYVRFVKYCLEAAKIKKYSWSKFTNNLNSKDKNNIFIAIISNTQNIFWKWNFEITISAESCLHNASYHEVLLEMFWLKDTALNEWSTEYFIDNLYYCVAFYRNMVWHSVSSSCALSNGFNNTESYRDNFLKLVRKYHWYHFRKQIYFFLLHFITLNYQYLCSVPHLRFSDKFFSIVFQKI